MDWAGMEDDVPIENGMINKSIENAQVKVESYHFDMRKHLVEYDDVVNTHRDVIYNERNKVLSGADLKSNIQEMLGEQLSEIVHETLGDGRPANWDIDGFLSEVGTILPPPPDLMDYDGITRMGLDRIEDILLIHAESLYGQMEKAIGREDMAEIERRLMLQAIDANWVQHLTTMEKPETRDRLVRLRPTGPAGDVQETGHGAVPESPEEDPERHSPHGLQDSVDVQPADQRPSPVCAPTWQNRCPAAVA